AQPDIIFDEHGVCSGCRLIESRPVINWEERGKWLKELLEEYKAKAKAAKNPYDCIIPISGGKDSHYQTYLMKKVYGMNPLLVVYNHLFNTKVGLRNLENLFKKFSCDLIRFSSNPDSVRKIARYMLEKIGDITWHYHSGIMTFPIQISVKYKIPLIIWGEEGFSELTGMFNQDDMVEFTKKKRQEHDMRGFEPEDLLEQPDSPFERKDLAPFFYPGDEEIESTGVRGIYLSNYLNWNAKAQAEKMIKEFDFETARERDRTFNIYDKTDDVHANGVHDYLKYLKFGYGRTTDDASTEIRHRRMTREQGIDMVMKFDPARPKDLDLMLQFLGITENEFERLVEPLRDTRIWEKDKSSGKWKTKDNIGNHRKDPGAENARLSLKEEGRFMINSKNTLTDPHILEGGGYNYL
ncbi:MAG: N-acetyl sugar amidotransferase, partial [Bacteroidetes bacterium]|nr:N-acetyl sugar amidotransferase [Bacteroidota bacterium]